MADYQGKGVWCAAEIRHGKLSPTAFELLTAARELAASRSEQVTAVLIGGPGARTYAEALAERGADKVLVVEHPLFAQFIDEAYARALEELCDKEKPSILLFPASVWGRSLAPRVAAALRGGLASDAIGLSLDAQGRLSVSRSCYAGNVIATVQLKRGPGMATVRPMAFTRSEPTGKKGEISAVALDLSSWDIKTESVSFTPEQSSEIDLSSAEKVISGGRGLGNPQGFELIRKFAHVLGAAVGASRATVDAGWIPYRHQVGLTGRSVRPRLYVACGISGQIQHLAGMSSSDIIVSINTDPDCPMMKLATYAVVGDLYKIIPAVMDEIAKVRGEAPAAAK